MNEYELAVPASSSSPGFRRLLPVEVGIDAHAHRMVYRHLHGNRCVEVIHAFHPVNYGSDITIREPANALMLGNRRLVHAKRKEEENPDSPF